MTTTEAPTSQTPEADDAGAHGGLGALLRENSLSLALLTLFVVCLALQSVVGVQAFDAARREAGLSTVDWAGYLATGDFLDGAFSNWQAAVLQLAVLIAFSSVLRQRGAAHSRKLAHDNLDALNAREVEWKFKPRKTLGEWLYANSLSLAFAGAFLVTLALHAWAGALKADEDRALQHLAAQGFVGYVTSAAFLLSLFQTWEAEFLAIALYVVLSIFLRQENSPESKPVDCTDEETGETNH